MDSKNSVFYAALKVEVSGEQLDAQVWNTGENAG